MEHSMEDSMEHSMGPAVVVFERAILAFGMSSCPDFFKRLAFGIPSCRGKFGLTVCMAWCHGMVRGIAYGTIHGMIHDVVHSMVRGMVHDMMLV